MWLYLFGVIVGVCAGAVMLDRAEAQVPAIVDARPIGTLEQGRVRIYELGTRCYVVVTDGPMGKTIASVACK